MSRAAIIAIMAALLVAVGIHSAPGAVVAGDGPGLDPLLVERTIKLGTSVDITKTVHTPTIAPNPHICFLADTTGSMAGPIASVQAGAAGVMALVNGVHPNAQFCVAEYKDVGDVFSYRLNQGLTTNKVDVQTGINAWVADGGGDAPEAQLNALVELSGHIVADPKLNASRIIVWFGDVSGHDPTKNGATQASAIAALTAAGIRVIAIDVGSLDGTGQATKITGATGGVLLSGVAAGDVAAAIVAGLTSLPVEVGMASNCAPPISTSFAPPSQIVTSGTDAVFTETISVAADAKPGTYECDDWATLNGVPMTDAAGAVILEHKIITVENPAIIKRPTLRNLWLCNIDAPTCVNKGSGVEEANFFLFLDQPVTSNSDKGEEQSIGSFEFEVRYDAKLLSLDVAPGELLTHPEVTCNTIRREGSVNFACLTKGKARVVFGPGTLAVVSVRATADVYSMLIANQLNGIATQLINQDCQLADLQGHPIKTELCSDADVTIRYLEGDVHADCVVNAIDQQQIAFRWGSRLGNLLYNSRMDLEPSQPIKGDGDIDAKDLQFVYGRHGSTCKAPHPVQDPVDPKFKPTTPTPAPAPPQ